MAANQALTTVEDNTLDSGLADLCRKNTESIMNKDNDETLRTLQRGAATAQLIETLQRQLDHELTPAELISVARPLLDRLKDSLTDAQHTALIGRVVRNQLLPRVIKDHGRKQIKKLTFVKADDFEYGEGIDDDGCLEELLITIGSDHPKATIETSPSVEMVPPANASIIPDESLPVLNLFSGDDAIKKVETLILQPVIEEEPILITPLNDLADIGATPPDDNVAPVQNTSDSLLSLLTTYAEDTRAIVDQQAVELKNAIQIIASQSASIKAQNDTIESLMKQNEHLTQENKVLNSAHLALEARLRKLENRINKIDEQEASGSGPSKHVTPKIVISSDAEELKAHLLQVGYDLPIDLIIALTDMSSVDNMDYVGKMLGLKIPPTKTHWKHCITQFYPHLKAFMIDSPGATSMSTTTNINKVVTNPKPSALDILRAKMAEKKKKAQL